MPKPFSDYDTHVQELRNQADKKEFAAEKIDNRYLLHLARIFTADVATIGFGILTGIIGLLNNNYVIKSS